MPSNPDSLNIKVVQVDAPPGQPYDEPMDPTADAVKVAAIFLVQPGSDNTDLAVWRDGNDLRFRDVSNPGASGGGKTLTELLSGAGGLTETAHKTLRQLIHFMNEGPGDGFYASPYREITPNPFPTSIIWYGEAAKTNKLYEIAITRNAQQRPTVIDYKVYDTDGSTVLKTATDTITYSGAFETDRTRTFS